LDLYDLAPFLAGKREEHVLNPLVTWVPLEEYLGIYILYECFSLHDTVKICCEVTYLFLFSYVLCHILSNVYTHKQIIVVNSTITTPTRIDNHSISKTIEGISLYKGDYLKVTSIADRLIGISLRGLTQLGYTYELCSREEIV